MLGVQMLSGYDDFNPRSPDGERQVNLSRIVTGGEFQSTLPGWGATF